MTQTVPLTKLKCGS